MRIALILKCLDPARGGAEQWTFQMAARMVRAGHDVTHIGEFQSREVSAAGVGWIPVSATRGTLGFACAVDRASGGWDFDVVADMGHTWTGDVILPHGGSRLASLRQNDLLVPPVLRWVRQGLQAVVPRYRQQLRLQRRQLDPTDGRLIIALSEMTERHHRTLDRVPAMAIRQVYNGVDIERFSPARCELLRSAQRAAWGITGDETIFLLVAHNFALKGVRELIAAFAAVARKDSNSRLFIAGKDRPGRYQRQADKEGCGDRVQFVGAIADSVAAYAAADVYVHPTYYDPCSLTVLEALACGLPVITTEFNGAGELITPGQEGFVIPAPWSLDELEMEMTALLDADLRRAMSREACELAFDHSLDRNYREFLAVLSEAANRRRVPVRRAA
jgi:UDP-glucose:(heptosyl)LPS alpha-1,3-glucosyltransferase